MFLHLTTLPREGWGPETVLRCAAGCSENSAQTQCSLPFPFAAMNLFHGHLLEEPGSACLEWRYPRDPACSLLWPQRSQGIVLHSSGDTRQRACPRHCPCLLLSLCWVSSLGISSSVMPGGEAAPTGRLSRRGVPRGKKAASLSPLQHSQKHGQALSKGGGSRKQQEVFGSCLESTS